MRAILLAILLAAITSGCAKKAIKPDATTCNCAPNVSLPDTPKTEETKPSNNKITEYSQLKPSRWDAMADLQNDDLTAAWPAWLQSCQTLKNKQKWQAACAEALQLSSPDQAQIAQYFENHFEVYQATQADGGENGLITGYYAPIIAGSRTPSAKYSVPLYKQPYDLITVELSELFPELKYKRLRGKLQGNKLVPYFSRAQIAADPAPLAGSELAWVADSVESFFLEVQGSGFIQLENGEKMHVGYADQNGHAYQSIGRILIERGELTKDQAGMQGIKNWAKKNPSKLQSLLNENPSYVFFKELPNDLPGPIGALGVPLTGARSIAVDAKMIPLGAPVLLATTEPNSNKPFKRLMQAQDTGGAIKGGVRADLFWGIGNEAGKKAGAMKQQGKMWVLLPKRFFSSEKPK